MLVKTVDTLKCSKKFWCTLGDVFEEISFSPIEGRLTEVDVADEIVPKNVGTRVHVARQGFPLQSLGSGNIDCKQRSALAKLNTTSPRGNGHRVSIYAFLLGLRPSVFHSDDEFS